MNALALSVLLLLSPLAVVVATTTVAESLEEAFNKCGNPASGAYNHICLQGELVKLPFDLDKEELWDAIASCDDKETFQAKSACAEGQLAAGALADAFDMCATPNRAYNPYCLQGELARQPIKIDQQKQDAVLAACSTAEPFEACALEQFNADTSAVGGDDAEAVTGDARMDLPTADPDTANSSTRLSTTMVLALVGLALSFTFLSA